MARTEELTPAERRVLYKMQRGNRIVQSLRAPNRVYLTPSLQKTNEPTLAKLLSRGLLVGGIETGELKVWDLRRQS